MSGYKILMCFLLSVVMCQAQMPADFCTQKISRQVRYFTPDTINLSSPLDYYISRAWIVITGKERLWADISTSKFMFDADASDRTVDDNIRDYVLNETIEEIVTYRDSAAVVITRPVGDDILLLNTCWIEDGRWVNGGQGIADNMDEAHDKAFEYLPQHYGRIYRIERIKRLPQDTASFTSFLSGVSVSPERFVLDMAASHKLVVNGEFHRRKVSWDMLKRLIQLPDFAEKIGVVFMELPSRCQHKMDVFMSSDILDSEIVLQIFREEQIYGWWDRGEFEFVCALWRLNHSLAPGNRIRIVLVDYQVPYSYIKTADEAIELEDRNTHMAEVIVENLIYSSDSRSGLFLVGCAHAYKSRQAGIASAAHGRQEAMTAAAQLVERLGDDNVFTVFQHGLSGDNSGNYKAPLRGGVFDRAFEAIGNRPVGFKLEGSPFGKEPFDGIYEIKYNAETGTYADNFDGYLFLHPIAGEPRSTPLTEVFTDEFVDEIKRRASVMGFSSLFGRPVKELTKEYITEILQTD